jgi:hypothetical protein
MVKKQKRYLPRLARVLKKMSSGLIKISLQLWTQSKEMDRIEMVLLEKYRINVMVG